MPKRKDPIVPTNKRNPANQTRRIQKALKPVDAAIDDTQAWLIHVLEAIPTTRANQVQQPKLGYQYQISLTRLEQIIAELQGKLGDGGIAVMQGAQAAYREGTALAAFNLAGLSDDYARTITQVLASEPYIRRSALAGARVMEEMKGFTAETSSDLARVLMIGIQDGRNPLDLARDIRERFSVSKVRAERIARTEITGALRRGRLDEAQDTQERLGIKTGMLWASSLSPSTRRSHAARHGRVYTVDDVRQFYSRDGNAINCFIPSTEVLGRFVAGSKARYEGPVITLVTAAGRNLTITPNHRVMTDSGLRAAAEIDIGDNLVAHCGEVENLARVGDLDSDLRNARIEDVFGALADLGHSRRSGVVGVDFHGDERFVQEDIDVVFSDIVLTVAGDASVAKVLDDLAFIKSDAVLHVGSPLSQGLDGINLTPAGSLGGGGVHLALLGGHNRMPDHGGVAHASGGHTPGYEGVCEGLSGNAMLAAEGLNTSPGGMLSIDRREVEAMRLIEPALGAVSSGVEGVGQSSGVDPDAISDALDGLARFVSLDQVVDVVKGHFSGHVYDLQEVSGLMIAGGIIASNCKCGLSEILLNDDGTPLSSNVVRKMTERREAYEKTPEAKAAKG